MKSRKRRHKKTTHARTFLFLGGILLALILTIFAFKTFDTTARASEQTAGFALRFYGNGVQDIDRVKIPIDNPEKPVDVAGDFTIEWWMKALASDNTSPACSSGGDNWINGNIMFDRDIYFAGDYGDYGISLYGGRIAFGVHNGSTGTTICGTSSVADGNWHHIAVTRGTSSGQMSIYVDGTLQRQQNGPTGNVSYRNGRATNFPDDPFLVIGAEKHDAGSEYPSYNGEIDEIRISNSLRYTTNFQRPTTPFITDTQTVALYHFDEGSGTVAVDSSLNSGGASNGTLNVGGNPVGPVFVTSTAPIGGSLPEPTGSTSSPSPTSPAPTVTPTTIPTVAPTNTPIPTATPAPTSAPTATPPPSSGNYSLIFDGSNDFASGQQIAASTGTQTIETWIRPQTSGANTIVIGHTNDTTGWSLELNSGRVTWWVANPGGSWKSIQHNTALQAGTWYHVAVTYQSGTARIFVNGTPNTAKSVGTISLGPNLRIGGISGYGFFNGQLDEVRISNIVRYTAAFSRPTTAFTSDASTVVLYHFNENNGQTLFDSSANGFNLTRGTSTGVDSADPQFTTSTAPFQ